jgi:hypothetical protein
VLDLGNSRFESFLFMLQFHWMWFLVSQSSFYLPLLISFLHEASVQSRAPFYLLILVRLSALSLPPGSSCSQFFIPCVKICFYRLFFSSLLVLPLECTRSDSGSSCRRPQLFSPPKILLAPTSSALICGPLTRSPVLLDLR